MIITGESYHSRLQISLTKSFLKIRTRTQSKITQGKKTPWARIIRNSRLEKQMHKDFRYQNYQTKTIEQNAYYVQRNTSLKVFIKL